MFRNCKDRFLKLQIFSLSMLIIQYLKHISETSVEELHHFYAAPAPDQNFDAATAAPAPASSLPYSRPTFFKKQKNYFRFGTFLEWFL
jgi:hypothetical protein